MANNVNIEHAHHEDHHIDHNALAIFGFWIYILTDVVLFATLFITFVVLTGGIYGGAPIAGLFDMKIVFAETMLLLTSSFTCGLAYLEMNKGNTNKLILWLFVTFLLGASFITLEIYEFAHLISIGRDWTFNASMSSFFVLVGTHGFHVSVGLLWSIILMIQIAKHKVTPLTKRKFTIFSLFWHFLDIIWIFVFTIVYLMGEI